MATKSDVATDVLEELGVLAAGETASAADSQKVQSVIDQVHAQLQRMGLAAWATSSIPNMAVLPLVHVVAWHCASAFGTPRDDAKLAVGMDNLRRQAAGSPSSEPAKADYF